MRRLLALVLALSRACHCDDFLQIGMAPNRRLAHVGQGSKTNGASIAAFGAAGDKREWSASLKVSHSETAEKPRGLTRGDMPFLRDK